MKITEEGVFVNGYLWPLVRRSPLGLWVLTLGYDGVMYTLISK